MNKVDEIMDLVDGLIINRLEQDYKDLRTAIEALVKDAERYKFMKSLSRAYGLNIGGSHSWTCQITRDSIQGATLDAAIDAAMKEQQ